MNKKAVVCAVLISMFMLNFLASEALACTVFTASYKGTVLFGNNEDNSKPGYIWFVPPTTDSYGAVYVGFKNLPPQGGMNEEGLCFDGNSLLEGRLNYHPELLSSDKWIGHLIMEKCATVVEAIEMAKVYSWGTTMPYQVHFADATGDAVVIGPGTDGELASTRKAVGDGYLISTNFNAANPQNYSCWRYDSALSMLSAISHEESLTVGYASSILGATHQEITVYSNVFDPQNLLVYLYYDHNFDQVVTFNLTEEIARDSMHEMIIIGSLFEGDTFLETPEGAATVYGITIAVAVSSIVIILKKKHRFRLKDSLK